MLLFDRLNEYVKTYDDADVCVYCGKPDCDKIALPMFLNHPEREFGSGDMCHSDCERELMNM